MAINHVGIHTTTHNMYKVIIVLNPFPITCCKLTPDPHNTNSVVCTNFHHLLLANIRIKTC